MAVSIGIDIGTTTLSVIAVSSDDGRVVRSDTVANGSFLKTANAYEKIQDPEAILTAVTELLSAYTDSFEVIEAIGITGQMHGIVYLDEGGKTLSPLYIWQDGRGNLPSERGTYAEEFSALTGYPSASGFGLVTHYYNLKNGCVPAGAVRISTIHDLLAMRLTGRTAPLTHASDAASLGCFDLTRRDFDRAALARAGIDAGILPEVTSDFERIGSYQGIPVAVAIGDNQASFIGSVREENTLLFNVGTGSQVSLYARATDAPRGCEARPLYGDAHILVGSSLCGGRAYAILESFFRTAGREIFGVDNGAVYDAMDRLAESADDADALSVNTAFSGTREDPTLRGSVTNIGIDNLTPAALVRGTLHGMSSELYNMYEKMLPFAKATPDTLVASGNGVRLNRPLRRIMETTFGMRPLIPLHREEAAFGAVLSALVAAKKYESVTAAARSLVRYEEEMR